MFILLILVLGICLLALFNYGHKQLWLKNILDTFYQKCKAYRDPQVELHSLRRELKAVKAERFMDKVEAYNLGKQYAEKQHLIELTRLSTKLQKSESVRKNAMATRSH